ncbi:hypothetical protein KHQ81_00730 [Mycoplasmatota bacterium]|nr:hypothetical protein KHQ81_00730 [Mycoplasmatota bacterium]
MSTMIKRIEKYSENIVEDKTLFPYDVEFYKEYFLTFLDNESHNFNKVLLVNVIENITWYRQSQINSFFTRTMTEEIFDYDFILAYKNKISSSSNNIISNLRQQGIIYDEILDLSKIKHTVKNKTLIILDDYVGSGNTIINNVLINKSFQNCKFIIIAFVWQELAISNLKKFLKSYKQNNVEIHKKNVIVEKNFEHKVNDIKTINYIKKICNGLIYSKEYYGYNNTGAMISLMGISPNNNISMIWRDDIIKDGQKWIPLLDREIGLKMITRYRIEVFKNNKKLLYDFYKKISKKLEITFEEYKVIYLFFVKKNIQFNEIKKILGYDNHNQINEIIANLKYKKIITFIDGYINILNQYLIKNMKDLTNRILVVLKKEGIERKKKTDVFLANQSS